MRNAPRLVLTVLEQIVLERWVREGNVPARLALRARIVLAAAAGRRNDEIAAELRTTPKTVSEWRTRFAELRLDGLQKNGTRRQRSPAGDEELERLIIEKTTQTKPRNRARWSTRTLARELRVSRSRVHRVWRANRIAPHLATTPDASRDPLSLDLGIDVVGLYLKPPEHALVLRAPHELGHRMVRRMSETNSSAGPVRPRTTFDSTSPALDRAATSRSKSTLCCSTRIDAPKRQDIATFILCTAIDVVESRLTTGCQRRERQRAGLDFLQRLDAETPSDCDLHVILNGLAARQNSEVRKWLKRQQRVHPHFLPTRNLWLDLMERLFRKLTGNRSHCSTSRNMESLHQSLVNFLQGHNDGPDLFTWIACESVPPSAAATTPNSRLVIQKFQV